MRLRLMVERDRLLLNVDWATWLGESLLLMSDAFELRRDRAGDDDMLTASPVSDIDKSIKVDNQTCCSL